jgi:hypothetical protein
MHRDPARRGTQDPDRNGVATLAADASRRTALLSLRPFPHPTATRRVTAGRRRPAVAFLRCSNHICSDAARRSRVIA